MSKPLFTVVYDDDTIFLGGDLYHTKWNEINKPIKRLHYTFPDGQERVLEDYKAYNHVIEVTQDVYPRNEKKISKITLSVRTLFSEYRFIWNKKTGKILSNRGPFDDVYTGWKEGI